MSKHTQEQNTNRDRRAPVSGEVYTNGHWVSVDDCQAPYSQQEQAPPATTGYTHTDEYGRQVWSDGKQSEY